MKRHRLWMLAAAFALWPSLAGAQGYWWDFVEGLSGPGPFEGHGGYVRLGCAKAESWRGEWTGEGVRGCWNDNQSDIRQTFELRALWIRADDRPRLIAAPEPDPRKVDAVKVDVLTALRVAPYLDLGFGGGFIRFYGEDVVDIFRPTIIPISVTFTPLAISGSNNLWRRAVKIRMEELYIPFGFTGKDWGDKTISAADYSTDGNWVLVGGALFEVPLIGKGIWNLLARLRGSGAGKD